MFIKSAARETQQGKAIQETNERWGQGKWNGTETIGISVCKKKYAPFSFKLVRSSSGRAEIRVERMFGCHCHNKQRKAIIEKRGCREGWEPFGQWSMQKAITRAKREADRINEASEDYTTEDSSSSDDDVGVSICNYGNCSWKIRAKYDNIRRELTGMESDDEFERPGAIR
mmetsp:Transcript_5477/g.7931  ORF Transcript_5477/g.7931 Transcript_5477/m.7931 type:complete len:171 (+) Transcript_5477:291-803(+)